MSAKPNFGLIFKMGTASPPSTTLTNVTSVTPPKLTRDAVDVTTHGSADGAMEFMADGVYDAGELQVSLNYVAGDANDDACLTAFLSGDLYHFSFTANAATTTETFSLTGVVIGYAVDELGVKGKQSATLSIKLSGPVTQAATA